MMKASAAYTCLCSTTGGPLDFSETGEAVAFGCSPADHL